MAWGNFTAVPCPYKKWHEESRRAMLIMLPLVGFLAGIIVDAVWALVSCLDLPQLLTGAVVTVLCFIVVGFIHLDGFMDCSDAILSRRPELEERQRILKDSSTGAFAVISLVLMMIVFLASVTVLTQEFSLVRAGALPVIFAASRAVSAGYVLKYPAMKMSQYRDLGQSRESQGVDLKKGGVLKNESYLKNARTLKNDGLLSGKGSLGLGEKLALAVTSLVPILAICGIITAICESCRLCQVSGLETAIFILAPAVVAAAAAAVSGRRDMRQLGGMSGDIAGHMIVTVETVGVFASAVIISVM